MSQYLRLTDWALTANNPQIESVIFDLLGSGSVLVRDIPFIVEKSMVVAGSRQTVLPTINWVDVNDTNIQGDHSVPSNFEEHAYIWRNMVATDRALIEDKNSFVKPHVHSVAAYLKSFAYDFNTKFILGKHTGTGADAKSLVGVRERLDNPDKYGTLAANKIDAGGVDLTKTGSAQAWQDFAEYLNEMLYAVGSEDGSGVVIYMAQKLKARIEAKLAALAGQGGFGQAKDQFGRMVTHYRGARIESIGPKVDQSTSIISTTESATGADGASTFTSIYAVNYSPGYCAGWTHLELKALDVPESDGIAKKTRLEWAGGLICRSMRSLSRLYNVKYA